MLGRELDPHDAARRLTNVGATVDAVEPLFAELGEVVVARVEHVAKHPDADRLSVCQVNTGSGTLEVVCGAPNVTAGALYPYAPVGATLPGGFQLEKRKIRGVVSNGMLCSAKELGIGADQAGILELHTDAAPGTPLLQAMPWADTRIEIDVTPNRPDLLCQKGVARELGATLDLPVRLPVIPHAGEALAPRRAQTAGTVGGIAVSLEDTEGCPRYIAAVIRGVSVGPSPDWLEGRLRGVGARSINNVVDATNYILHEINQPLHAFDLRRLRRDSLIVRRARPGERLTTLDGVDRALTPDMTMICDAEGPIAIAGVMGGAHAEVVEDTTDILLECAYFDPVRTRATRNQLNMSTDASYRFERGIDLQGMPGAVRRAVELIIAVAGGEEAEASLDLLPHSVQPTTVFLRPDRVAHLLGVPVDVAEIEGLLTSVGFAVAPKDQRLAVQAPGWRPDVTREVDLIEEVARLKGYDAFPVEWRPYRPTLVPDAPSELVSARLRRLLTGLGLHEARTLTFGPAFGARPQAIENPLSNDEAFLRGSLLPGLVRSVEHNWSARTRDVRLFEIGRVFQATDTGRPDETLRAGGVISGARLPSHWSAAGPAPDLDLWDLKGMLEDVVRAAVPGGRLQPGEQGGWTVHSGDGRQVGIGRQLDADSPPWSAPLFGFEVDIEREAREAHRFAPLPHTPASDRDVALVLPATVTAEEVEQATRVAGTPLLESVTAFDEYRSDDLEGRSVAWRLVFRAADRTLRDTEVDRAVEKILHALKEQLGVERRES
ncbi:MAG TPA: phenylalanine--tRNA ligase subunit beta [Gemmatimonadales bacterium]